ncbi:hypothetical protein C8Q79DRAFT_709355 [Trametes meyenii]|nr:hypothetical protein C8Q79DRAFT_709355 [Trametes meyenii]
MANSDPSPPALRTRILSPTSTSPSPTASTHPATAPAPPHTAHTSSPATHPPPPLQQHGPGVVRRAAVAGLPPITITTQPGPVLVSVGAPHGPSSNPSTALPTPSPTTRPATCAAPAQRSPRPSRPPARASRPSPGESHPASPQTTVHGPRPSAVVRGCCQCQHGPHHWHRRRLVPARGLLFRARRPPRRPGRLPQRSPPAATQHIAQDSRFQSPLRPHTRRSRHAKWPPSLNLVHRAARARPPHRHHAMLPARPSPQRLAQTTLIDRPLFRFQTAPRRNSSAAVPPVWSLRGSGECASKSPSSPRVPRASLYFRRLMPTGVVVGRRIV